MIIAALVNRGTVAELISPCLHTRSVLAECDYEIKMAAFSHGGWVASNPPAAAIPLWGRGRPATRGEAYS